MLFRSYIYENRSRIAPSDFDTLRSTIDSCLDRALIREFQKPEDLEGKNILLRNVIRELIVKILEMDERHAPFELKQLEQKVIIPFAIDDNRSVRLLGIIDRVDEHQGCLRVLDYKTGSVKSTEFNQVEELFNNVDKKEQFQALYYSMLINFKYTGRPVKVGLITLKEMKEGIKYINKGEPIENEKMIEFEKELRKLKRK